MQPFTLAAPSLQQSFVSCCRSGTGTGEAGPVLQVVTACIPGCLQLMAWVTRRLMGASGVGTAVQGDRAELPVAQVAGAGASPEPTAEAAAAPAGPQEQQEELLATGVASLQAVGMEGPVDVQLGPGRPLHRLVLPEQPPPSPDTPLPTSAPEGGGAAADTANQGDVNLPVLAVVAVSPTFIAVRTEADGVAAGPDEQLDILVLPQFTGRVRVLLLCPCQGILMVDEVHEVEVGRATSLRCVRHGMPVLGGHRHGHGLCAAVNLTCAMVKSHMPMQAPTPAVFPPAG
jgi:hypothetical protein